MKQYHLAFVSAWLIYASVVTFITYQLMKP